MTIVRARDPRFRIGQVAKATGVSVEALRYYERLGLLAPRFRTEGGERRYGADAVSRVHFIRQAQALGLRLREIRDLVGDREARSGANCRDVHALLTGHIAEIDRRARELRALRSTLSEYRRRCEQALADEQDPACPTLEALGDETETGGAPVGGLRRLVAR